MPKVKRPWQAGILYHGGNTAFATRLLKVLSADDTLTVGDNEPYSMDAIDYTVPRHAYPAGLAYAEVELRQDVISMTDGCAEWAARLARALRAANT